MAVFDFIKYSEIKDTTDKEIESEDYQVHYAIKPVFVYNY